MFKPKQPQQPNQPPTRQRLPMVERPPRQEDIAALFTGAMRIKGCSFELPVRPTQAPNVWLVTCQFDTFSNETVWSMYEGEHGSLQLWTCPHSDLDLVFDMVCMQCGGTNAPMNLPLEVQQIAPAPYQPPAPTPAPYQPPAPTPAPAYQPPQTYPGQQGYQPTQQQQPYTPYQSQEQPYNPPYQPQGYQSQPQPQPQQPPAAPYGQPSAPYTPPQPSAPYNPPFQPAPGYGQQQAPYPSQQAPYTPPAQQPAPAPAPAQQYQPSPAQDWQQPIYYPQQGYNNQPGQFSNGQAFPQQTPVPAPAPTPAPAPQPTPIFTPGQSTFGSGGFGGNSSASPLVTPEITNFIDLINKGTPNLLLGHLFVEAGIVPNRCLDAALKCQELVRHGKLTNEQAVLALKRAAELGGILDDDIVAWAQDPEGARARSRANASNQLGSRPQSQPHQAQVPPQQHVSPPQPQHHQPTQPRQTQPQPQPQPRPSQPQSAPGPGAYTQSRDNPAMQKVIELLKQAGLVSEADVETARKVRSKHGGELAQILVSAGKVSAQTLDAASQCQELVTNGRLRIDRAIMTLHYCERMRAGLKEAFEELHIELE